MSVAWTAEGNRIEVAGTGLEYACFGPSPDQAPTLVMLHEGLGCVALWRDFPERVAAQTGCGVLVYSRAGYGRSDAAALPRPLDYMEREAMGVLGPVLDALGVSRCILLGHSDGASIAAIYAGSVSDMRVRGLILIAPHFFVEPQGLEAIKAAGVAYDSGDLAARLAKYHDDPTGAFKGWHDVWSDPDFGAWNIGDSIDHWRIPVLAVQGTDDPYGTLAQIEEIATRIYSPLDRLIVEGAGHAPHLEAPEAVMAAVAEFSARLWRLEGQGVAPT